MFKAYTLILIKGTYVSYNTGALNPLAYRSKPSGQYLTDSISYLTGT